jgi:hypothetical protein
MRSSAPIAAAAFACLFAAFAIAVSLAVFFRPIPKPAQMPLMGVCVVTDPYALGTDGGGPYAAVNSVSQATRMNGVVTCEAGSYVPVTPK